jgi:ParB family chromosome partitioning protein
LSSVNDSPRRGLGRGLEVLIGGAGQAELLHLPVEMVHANPRQPRRRFEPEATSGLAASIRHQGVLQPVVVRPRPDGGYELIAGERRWRAAREAGIPTIPAVVRHTDDRDTLLLGLVENVARENLSPVEEARAYASLIDEFELSLGDVAERVGRSKPAVSNRVRLLELPEDVLWMLARGEITEGHARAVLSLPDDDARRRLAKRIANDGMTVRAAEKAARDGGARRRAPRAAATHVDPALADRARSSAQRLTGLPARVSAGKLELHFGDDTGLAELVEVLEGLVAAAEHPA